MVMLEKIRKSVEYIKALIDGNPKTGIILGSGLGGFTKEIEIIKSIPYHSIPEFPDTTVEGHSGMLLHARVEGIDVLVMQGRIHFYEGHNISRIVYPVRVMKYLGVENLILSNASGGMNETFQVGDLMIINDHINLMPNPLVGPHETEFGARFPDMSEAYNLNYINKAKEIALKNGIHIHEGVYVAVTGPTYETPAEYKFFRIIGGDVVGMSTVPEVIAANQMGIKCFAVSVVTDLGVPGKIEYMTHDQVQKAAAAAEPKLSLIVKELIKTM
jgi:purine-nucleoside phosphorylase